MRCLRNACATLIFVAALTLAASSTTYAQNASCSRFGFLETRQNFDGLWRIEHSSGVTQHTTTLGMQGKVGASITEFYDTDTERTRRIMQVHLMCQWKHGIVILGFAPTDKDTGASGSAVHYNADNFFISRDTRGNLKAFNYDDGKTGSEADITYLGELPKQNSRVLAW